MREKMCAINLPEDAFTSCPSCRSSNYLRQLAFDVYCHGCSWDSSSSFVNAGGLDALVYEYEMKHENRAKKAAAKALKVEVMKKRKQQMMQCEA